MEYILNKLPVKTTNSFRVNDLRIELDIPEVINNSSFSIKNGTNINIRQENVNKELESKIGLSFSKYLDIDITIPKNVKVDDTVLLEYDFSNSDVLVDRVNIKYEENSFCNLVFIYRSLDNSKSFHHLVTNINNKNGSHGNITYINLLNDFSYNFIAIENEVLDKSSITNNIIDIGSCIKVYNVCSNVYSNASNYLNNIYIGDNDSIIDMNYYLNNIGINSKNIMRVEGAIDDNTKKIFRGTIDFVEGCKNSIGDENENCVMLSDSAISRSLPQMLCHEEDVIGAHGVSSGKVDDNKLFYLMTHGYTKKEAEKLIVMGNFSNIINNIDDEIIRDEIISIIEKKF